MNPETKAVHAIRELGADASEEFEAFRAAQQKERAERRMIEAELDSLFFQKGWTE